VAGSERSPTLSSHLRNGGESSHDHQADHRRLTSPHGSSGDFGFTGTFVSEDTVVAGSLDIRPDRVIMWASGSQLASWPIDQCRVERLTVSRFAVHAEGETLTFTADDPTGLDEAISAAVTNHASDASGDEIATIVAEAPPPSRLRAAIIADAPPPLRLRAVPPPEPEPETTEPFDVEPPAAVPEPAVAATAPPPIMRRARIKNFQAARSSSEGEAERTVQLAVEPAVVKPVEVESEEGETPAELAIARSRFKTLKAARFQISGLSGVGIKVGAVVLAAIVLSGLAYSIYVIAGGTGVEPDVVVRDPTTTAPPRPNTTSAVVIEPPVSTTRLFQTDPAELTARWNLLAEATRPELILMREITSPLLVNLTPFMTLEGVLDPTSGYLSLRSIPTGTREGDGAILTSLGMMIAISDPTLEPVDRRLLLESLGIDVRNPQLGGIDASLDYNGLNYRLTYLQDQNVLEFVIRPQAAVTTTTP
jgi:hypothetical protein